MTFVNGLKCRECGREYPKQPIAGCEDCFGPLEVDYDYEGISRVLSREVVGETGTVDPAADDHDVGGARKRGHAVLLYQQTVSLRSVVVNSF